jgi:hypothetical protein
LRIIAIWLESIRRLLKAKIGVAVDLNNVWPMAFAVRWRKFAKVLYWLEPFYGDYGKRLSISTNLGRRSLERLVPPDALIDVEEQRLVISHKLCREPASSFVLRNTPPLAFLTTRRSRNKSERLRLVYSGSVTGLGAEGIELMARAVAVAKNYCTLTVFPAEGRSASRRLEEIVEQFQVGDRVVVKDRVERSLLGETLTAFDIGVVLYPVRELQNNNSLMAAPNKLYEYLASGLSVLASSNQTMQFVSRECLGWNIDARSTEEIAKFLDGLCRAEVEACCGRAARAFRERYNYESQAEPVLRWFVQRLETHDQPRKA